MRARNPRTRSGSPCRVSIYRAGRGEIGGANLSMIGESRAARTSQRVNGSSPCAPTNKIKYLDCCALIPPLAQVIRVSTGVSMAAPHRRSVPRRMAPDVGGKVISRRWSGTRASPLEGLFGVKISEGAITDMSVSARGRVASERATYKTAIGSSRLGTVAFRRQRNAGRAPARATAG